MNRSLDLLLTRHGTATYKHGIFDAETSPYDLDENGKQQACAVGGKIRAIADERMSRGGYAYVKVVSSPITRAINTAYHISDALGYEYANIEVEPAVRCIDKYNDEGFNAIWGQFPNGHDVDGAWMAGDPRFEGNFAFESRSVIYTRGAGWLLELFNEFSRGESPGVLVMVSHAEVLNMLVERLFVEPIHQCELVHMQLTPGSEEGTVSVFTDFRNEQRQEQFELLPTAAEFGRQFSKYL